MGALVLYGGAAWFGPVRLRALVVRYHRWHRITEGDLDRAEAFFDRPLDVTAVVLANDALALGFMHVALRMGVPIQPVVAIGSQETALFLTRGEHLARLAAEMRESAAGGLLAAVAYTWSHPQDGAQEGLLVVGTDEQPERAVALWGDSWHQKPAAKHLRGVTGHDTLTVGYAYAESWEWRITLTADRPDTLRWRMDNVVPPSASGTAEAVTYWAMDGELRRPD